MFFRLFPAVFLYEYEHEELNQHEREEKKRHPTSAAQLMSKIIT